MKKAKAKRATKQSRTLPVKDRATYKVSEAARVAGCGERSIRDGIASGDNPIPHIKFGRNIVIPKEAFHRYLDNCGQQAPARP
jgi:excisionase family DNA binding protein